MAEIPQRPRGPLVYRGAKEICGAVGVSYKEIALIVRELGMPAFKIRGNWVARPSSLEAWLAGLEAGSTTETQRHRGGRV
jgi:hypothetical protein